MKKTRSTWGSVRAREGHLRRDLQQRHWLRLHGTCIGLLVLGVMWAATHLQMVLGTDSLALRYGVTLGVGYLAYLLILRLWAGALVGENNGPDIGDIPLPDGGGGSASHVRLPTWQSGGGGDFGGGGATADFSGASEAGSLLGDVASGAADVVGGSDEGAVVVVPLVAIFLIGIAVVLGTGSLLLLYFGWDALLAVAVEVAFGYVSGRTAVRMAREGWLSAAVRLTWKPLLGALLCAVLLGATIDHFIPSAKSLPHAVQLIRSSH